MEWNRETILHFISLIRQRPAIWDLNSLDYRNKRKRNEAVEEVGLLMGVTPMEVNTKWIILRSQYSRERRKITESKGEYQTKWYAYKELEGLMGRKRPNKNFWMQERQSDAEDSSSSPPPQLPLRESASTAQHPDCAFQTASIFNQAIKTLKALRETNNNNAHTNDELINYGLYIGAHIRKFSPPLQSRAKYEINKILYALDLESMGEFSATIPSLEDNDDITISKDCKYDPLQRE